MTSTIDAFAGREIQPLRERFLAQDEFLVIPDLLPKALLAVLLGALPGLRHAVHRNFIPKHKKGGSISRYTLDASAPQFPGLYLNPDLRRGLEQITGQTLLDCPAEDPHTYALYYYTEPGDHIGWHYDTSYYRGIRYTVLIGLVDRSSSRLECQLYRGNAKRRTEDLSLALAPGMLVVFNGDKVYHRVTPLGANEERIALTMEYVTDPSMAWFPRFVSNMKDAIAYFGLKAAFGRGPTI